MLLLLLFDPRRRPVLVGDDHQRVRDFLRESGITVRQGYLTNDVVFFRKSQSGGKCVENAIKCLRRVV